MRTTVLLSLLLVATAQWSGGGSNGGGGSGGGGSGFGFAESSECQCALPRIFGQCQDGSSVSTVCVWKKDVNGKDDCTWQMTPCPEAADKPNVYPRNTDLPVPPPLSIQEKCKMGSCPLTFSPVCGSDGAVYGNDCERTFSACVKGVTIDAVKCNDNTLSAPTTTVTVQGTQVEVSKRDECQCNVTRLSPIRPCPDNTTFEGPGACAWLISESGEKQCRRTWHACPSPKTPRTTPDSTDRQPLPPPMTPGAEKPIPEPQPTNERPLPPPMTPGAEKPIPEPQPTNERPLPPPMTPGAEKPIPEPQPTNEKPLPPPMTPGAEIPKPGPRPTTDKPIPPPMPEPIPSDSGRTPPLQPATGRSIPMPEPMPIKPSTRAARVQDTGADAQLILPDDECTCKVIMTKQATNKACTDGSFTGPANCRYFMMDSGEKVCRQTWRDCPIPPATPVDPRPNGNGNTGVVPPPVDPTNSKPGSGNTGVVPPPVDPANSKTGNGNTGVVPPPVDPTNSKPGSGNTGVVPPPVDPAKPTNNNGVLPPPLPMSRCRNDFCLMVYKPVCGSDGQTYGNLCQFANAVCNDATLKVVDANGPCDGDKVNVTDRIARSDVQLNNCMIKCVDVDKPVCGSDGKTYSNECALRNAACRASELSKLADGECQAKDVNSTNPCESQSCPDNTACVAHRPICFNPKAACPLTSRCVPVASKNDGDNTIAKPTCLGCDAGCSKLGCPRGTKCVTANSSPELARVSSCIPIETNTSSNWSRPTTKNSDSDTGVHGETIDKPLPDMSKACDGIVCPDKTTCTVSRVACVKEPCAPLTSCTPSTQGPDVLPTPPKPTPPKNDDPCATTQCPDGKKCVAQSTTCFQAPCPKQAQCVPSDDCKSTNCAKDDPVCGTDGSTYPNRCAVDNAVCRGIKVAVNYTGACRTACNARNGASTCSAFAQNMECYVAGGYCVPKNIDPCASMKCPDNTKCRFDDTTQNATCVSDQKVDVCNPVSISNCVAKRIADSNGNVNFTKCAIQTLIVACSGDVGCVAKDFCKTVSSECALSQCTDRTVVPTRAEARLTEMLTAFTAQQIKIDTEHKSTLAGIGRHVYLLGGACLFMAVALIALGIAYRRLSRQLSVAGAPQQEMMGEPLL